MPTISWPISSRRMWSSAPSKVSRASSEISGLCSIHLRQRVSASDRCTQVQPTWLAIALPTASLATSSAVPSGSK